MFVLAFNSQIVLHVPVLGANHTSDSLPILCYLVGVVHTSCPRGALVETDAAGVAFRGIFWGLWLRQSIGMGCMTLPIVLFACSSEKLWRAAQIPGLMLGWT